MCKPQGTEKHRNLPKVMSVRVFSGKTEILRQSGKKCFFSKNIDFCRFWVSLVYIYVDISRNFRIR